MPFRKIAIVAAGIAALLLSASSGQSASSGAGAPAPQPAAQPAQTHTLDRADLEAWLDGMVPYALKSGDIAGADVVVVKDGKILLEKGYGYADVAKKVPMDPERSLIRPGSTSKLFTWTAVMQLVEQGKLDLDKDVNTYLDFKAPRRFDKPITLRDLMNHRAGFEEGLKDILATDPKAVQSTEQYLKRHPRPQLFAPGEVPAYSNYGAALAGYIVERVSGEPFERYVERHIFLPLGMNHATFDQPLPDRFKPDLAQGYMTASGKPNAYEYVITRPAGSVTTTAADMSRFMLAHLQQGRLGDYAMLSPQTTQLMHTPSETNPPGFATLAHGFFHFSQNGHTVIGHGGDTVVFHTEMNLLPQEGVGIFYTFNSRGRESAVYGARKALFDGFMDRYYPAPADSPLPPPPATAKQDAQAIAGLYQSSRRVEHGFLSLFYLLQQTPIKAGPDGTILAPGFAGAGVKSLREVGPQVWREVGGAHEIALKQVGGVKTIVDSDDPTSVLQAVPFARSAPLNLTLLMFSVAVLLWTLVLWFLSPLLRRGDRAEIGTPAPARRLRLYQRGAVAVSAVYLLAWFMLLQPLLGNQIQVYGAGLDPVVATLEIAGFLIVAAAGLSAWWTWKLWRVSGVTWLSRIWNGATSLALLALVWVGAIGGLIGFNLNY